MKVPTEIKEDVTSRVGTSGASRDGAQSLKTGCCPAGASGTGERPCVAETQICSQHGLSSAHEGAK